MVNLTRGHDFSVLFDAGTCRLVLQAPSGGDSGTSVQLRSRPLGSSEVPTAADWEAPTVVRWMLAFTGANVGPGGGGLQLKHNKQHAGRRLFCGHKNTNSSSPKQRATAVWISDSGGNHWNHTVTIEGLNECDLVERRDGTVPIDSRNQIGPTNPTSRSDCHCRLSALSSDGGASFGNVTNVVSLPGSTCQGAMISDDADAVWLYTGPKSRVDSQGAREHGRDNLTLFSSND